MHQPLLEGIRATSLFNMTCLFRHAWPDILSVRWLKFSQPNWKHCMRRAVTFDQNAWDSSFIETAHHREPPNVTCISLRGWSFMTQDMRRNMIQFPTTNGPVTIICFLGETHVSTRQRRDSRPTYSHTLAYSCTLLCHLPTASILVINIERYGIPKDAEISSLKCLTIADPLIWPRVSQVHVSCTKVPNSCLSTTERSKAWQFPYGSFSLVIVIRARRLCRTALVFVIILRVLLTLTLRLCFIRHDHRVEIGNLDRTNISDDNNNTCDSSTRAKARWIVVDKSMGSITSSLACSSQRFSITHPPATTANIANHEYGRLIGHHPTT
jgi:hypothetical protein